MTNLKLLAAAVVFSSAFVGPAMAQHVISHPGVYARNGSCQSREPGNPYRPETDYQQWSAWRAEGGWDSRNDCWNESRSSYRRPGVGF